MIAQSFTGAFTIKNKESGKYVTLPTDNKGKPVASDNVCVKIDRFEWEAEPDGIYGKIKSRFSGEYVTLSNKFWEKKVYMADKVEGESWRLQKWRILDGMLVNDIRTEGKNGLPVVLAYDPAKGKLKFSKIECGNSALKWDLSPVDAVSAGSPIPKGTLTIK